MRTFYTEKFEAEQIAQIKAKKNIPDLKPGAQVKIGYSIVEDQNTRTQYFEGTCIAVNNKGIATSIVVRKLSVGKFGIERTFKIYSPLVASIEIIRYGIVRRAKLYYLSKRIGKSAKLQEDFAYLAKKKD
jgi:large subunit ribosomal protein L19